MVGVVDGLWVLSKSGLHCFSPAVISVASEWTGVALSKYMKVEI